MWYAGYNIDDLAEQSSFEEVLFLLWNDRLSIREELDTLETTLRNNRRLASSVERTIVELAPYTAPRDMLRTAVSMLAGYTGRPNDVEESPEEPARNCGKRSTIVAYTHSTARG